MDVRAFGLESDPRTLLAFSGRTSDVPGGGNVSLAVGNGRPAAARAALLASLGLDPGAAVFMEQVHGAGVAVVGRGDVGRGVIRHDQAVPGVDALVTLDTDVALVVQVADCVPVLLADPGRGVAAVHAGRRGIEAGVIDATLDALAPPEADRVAAVVGPAIGGCCYEVPASLADEIAGVVPAAVATTTWGTPALDLPAAARAQLAARGVTSVAGYGSCTRCESDRWFSHRVAPGEGRQAAAITRRSVSPVGDGRHGSLDWDA
ncbi:laccase domain-containing protein [Egibacter rhizosphaerae]|uniref:Laccase domain-containing protein n=1 Tax=Egibacter rhizosphaerae TaxID=1670831 RepID=A0A411YKY1_9ACTN|nr:laccase domain-containing protein [Egibacter rhizosphaerae]